MSQHNFNLDPFNFSKLKSFFNLKFGIFFLILTLTCLFLLIWILCKKMISNQEIFNVLQGKNHGVFLTKKCVGIYEKDNQLLFRLSDLLQDSNYYIEQQINNIVFLNLPHKSLVNFNNPENSLLGKKIVIKALLPLIIQANNSILEDRKKVIYLNSRMPRDELTEKDMEIFKYLINKYNVNVTINTSWDVISGINELLVKVNIIPNSLFLALMIRVTDWGKINFLQQESFAKGNSKNKNDNLIKPVNQLNNINKNSTLSDVINAYLININSNDQYKTFREQRFKQINNLLNNQKSINSVTLSNYLEQHFALYNKSSNINSLSNIIKENRLTVFDKYNEVTKNNTICIYFR